MEQLKKYKTIILSIVILLALAIIGFSYAYYNANVIVVSETQTIIRSKKLALTFNDTKEINVADMIPGKSVEKTFNVVSTADDIVTYNIKWKDITSTYNEDLVYTLTRDGEVVVQETLMPKTNPEEYILTNISIEPNETHDYVLKIEFLYTDEPQGGGVALEFTATVEIDTEKIDTEIIHVPYTTNEISSTKITEESKIENEFVVKSTSVNATQKYNILLEDIENEYEEGELTYSLEKNGEEISTGNVPQEGKLPYLTIGENLTAGTTDTYELTITENINNTVAYKSKKYKINLLSNEISENSLSKKFSAKVVIDQKDADTTPPEANLEFISKTTNSASYKASCIDKESGITSYKFYKNGELLETKETIEENIDYTFKKLETKEYEFKLVCTNKMGVTTALNQRVTPTGLIEPVYDVASGWSANKKVEIKYTGEGTYLFKATGNVTSSVAVTDCGDVSEGATFSCTSTTVAAGSTLTSGKWYKVDSSTTLTFTSNGSIVAKVADGTNYVSGEVLEVTQVDPTAPSAPVLGTVSNYGKSLTVAFTSGADAQSGVTHTCYYGTSSNPTTAGTLSGTTCSFNNLTQGTTYYYKVCATNGAGTQTCSSVGSTTTYTGVAAGTYTTGSTVSYGGLTWYVLGDTGAAKGSYLKLVLNTVSGSGTYNNANTYLNSTFLNTYSAINTDKSRGGLVAQGSNYVTTDSGTTAYRPNYVYWNKSGYVVIPNTVSKYALSSYTYRSSGFGYNVELIEDSDGHHYYYGGVTSSTLYTAGQNVALANTSSSITYTNGGFNTTTGSLSSWRSMELMPSNTVATPSAKTLPMTYEVYSLEATGINTNKATLTASYENKNTQKWVLYPCGPTEYAVTLTAVSSTQYNYTNGNTGGNSNKNYSSNILYSFAGNVSSSTEGSSPSYKRTYDFWGNGNNCTAYTAYSLKNTSANVYYRPYILVREAYAS